MVVGGQEQASSRGRRAVFDGPTVFASCAWVGRFIVGAAGWVVANHATGCFVLNQTIGRYCACRVVLHLPARVVVNIMDRIAQFKNMTEADPHNEMGHFSLGKAYIDSGQFAEAVAPLRRTLELNPTYSKAYQLLGEALAKSGDVRAAIETLTNGFNVADQRGDRMPRDAMAQLIRELGAKPPEPSRVAPPAPQPQAAAGGDADFVCSRCGRSGGNLPERPFKGELGERIKEQICQLCWREWISMGTKVINELGLQLSDPRAQRVYDEQMMEFLQLR